MTRAQFTDLLIEKVVLTSLVAVFSSAILFSYNLYSRSFEASREQSKGLSAFAIKNKDIILSSSAQVQALVSGVYYGYLEKGKTNPGYDMVSQIVQINSAINVLDYARSAAAPHKPIFTNSVKAAGSLKDKLANFRSKFDVKENKIHLDNLPKAILDVNADEQKFVLAFNTELAQLLSDEFTNFYQSYYDTVPWYARPVIFAALSLIALLACVILFIFLPRRAANHS